MKRWSTNNNARAFARAKKKRPFKKRRRMGPLAPAVQLSGWRINNSLIRTSAEKKFIDHNSFNVMQDGTVTYKSLCNADVGAEVNQRIGNQMNPKSFYIRINTYPNFLVTPGITGNINFEGAAVRYMLVLDTQPNNTLFSLGGATALFLQDQGQYTSQSMLNLASRARFRVLWDKTIVLPAATVANGELVSSSDFLRYFKKFKVLPRMTTTYSGPGAT